MNKLDTFIENNRNEMDGDDPSTKVWESVEAALNKKSVRKFGLAPMLKWSVAAAVLVMVAFGGYFIAENNDTNGKVPVLANDSLNNSYAPEPPEIGLTAILVAQRQEELKSIAKEQPELYQKFTTDITQLDSSYKSLKNRLNTSPNRELLIEAMVQNLQLQLNVLNQQLNIIHQIKQSKNYSHEKIDQHI